MVVAHQPLSFSFVKKHIKKIGLDILGCNKHISFTEEQWEELKRLEN